MILQSRDSFFSRRLLTACWCSLLFVLVACASSLSAAQSAQPPTPAPDPYFRLRDTTLGYHGVAEDFTDLREIRLGWFGPSDTADPLHGDFWWAANFAVEDANHHPTPAEPSAFAALPIRLVPCWAPDPWRAGVSLLARMVYDEQPLALIGSVDSASTHLAEQIVAKAQLPLISPIATDKTATLAGVAWMFSCAPDDTAVARVLVDDVLAAASDADRSTTDAPAITSRPRPNSVGNTPTPAGNRHSASGNRKSPLVLLATTDHESRAAAREVMRELSRRGRLPEFRFDLPPDVPDATEPLRSVRSSHPATVIVIANAPDSARLVRTVREQLGNIPVVGGPAMGRTRFVELAGPAAEGVRFPLLFALDARDEATARFTTRFLAARHHEPDYAAALAYDSTRLLIASIRRAGPNRARIREALVQFSPWIGIAGPISFDGTGQNRRADLRLGTIRAGVVAALNPPPTSDTVTDVATISGLMGTRRPRRVHRRRGRRRSITPPSVGVSPNHSCITK
ncbi:ABC-type branched-chain amino acid transport systems periplasmic component-like protein [Opitutus terrae PB90-1]|uniref:ABC-type branched-chain amino acid transport systems periplasmic component-like protein n=1 Tax=Opitutus terrae (strain DSM 11246 / JCM 15787 / PB90-1) TaxID=452637 RepID=B1ZY82_OPITP|nr:ABC-type branched-chain amino acid transport systems periplasmic component-like protein [Opitutus terrae PB90-1]